MNRHLVDDDIASAVAGLPLIQEAQDHLKDCLSCRREVQAMKSLLEERREQQLAGAPNWSEQHRSILDKLPQLSPIQSRTRRPRWVQPMMALAASILIVIGIGIVRFSANTTQPLTTTELTLEEILAETESLLNNDSIPGLWVADPVSNIEDIESLFGNGTS